MHKLSKLVKDVKSSRRSQQYPAYIKQSLPPPPPPPPKPLPTGSDGNNIMATVPHDYPRPDFVRTALHWESLDGPWDLIFDDADVGMLQGWHHHGLPTHAASPEGKPSNKRTIQVPFVFQSPASGINEQAVHQVLWYERRIEDSRSPEQRAEGNHLLLRFGAVDYHAKVWLDGQFVGEHKGGHVPFDLDLTESLALTSAQTSRVTIRVFDSAFDLTQPRGKQYWEPEPRDIFYTPSSGIWQSVWLETVPQARIVDGSYGTIFDSTNIEKGVVSARLSCVGRLVGQPLTIEVESSLGGVVVGVGRQELPRDEDFVHLLEVNMRLGQEHFQALPQAFTAGSPSSDTRCWRNGVALWSPECPFLYDIALRLIDHSGSLLDEVRTTTGMRSLDWTKGDGTFRLNDQPIFQSLFLDQGYWPDTLLTPPSSEALKRDIELSKAMGFNGCRKHQKVEDPRFFYWADRLGFLVWGEMASPYRFGVEMIRRFDQEWMEMVRRDVNHPSIVTWTPVNESWGYPELNTDKRQRDHIRSLYYNTKTYDPTRPINDNCGWEHVVTDISSFHEYLDGPGMSERCASMKDTLERGHAMFLPPIYGPNGVEDEGSRHQRGAPVMCTEYGGINIAQSKDEARKDNWGYTTASDAKDLLERLEAQVMAVASKGHIVAHVYTQFSDIEQEQNGLYTYDRKEKLPAHQVKEIMERAQRAYFAKLR